VTEGGSAENLGRVDALSERDRDRLRSTMRHVRDTQEMTASRFATHTVT
jgi:hypothetical protein